VGPAVAGGEGPRRRVGVRVRIECPARWEGEGAREAPRSTAR
jgi:hypothetical protein